MASGTLVGGSNGNGNNEGSREKHRWQESKVYTRKSFNKRSDPSQNPSSTQILSATTSTTAGAGAVDSSSQLHPPPPPAPPDNSSASAAASDDNSCSLQIKTLPNGRRRVITVSVDSRSKHESRDLRQKLAAELDQVRALVRRLESKERQFAAVSLPTPTSTAAAANCSLSQISGNDVMSGTCLEERPCHHLSTYQRASTSSI